MPSAYAHADGQEARLSADRVQLINLLDKRFFIATQSEFVGTHTHIPRMFLFSVGGEC